MQFENIYVEQKAHTYLNLFAVDRGQCRICNNIMKCAQYRGNYNFSLLSKRDIFACLECGCPMNSHVILEPSQSFSNTVCNHLSNKFVASQHLNFKCKPSTCTHPSSVLSAPCRPPSVHAQPFICAFGRRLC